MADTPVNNPVAAAVDAVQAKNGTAPEAAPAQEQATDPRFEAMARKERQLHKQRKEIEAERNQLKSKIAEYETGYIPKQRLTEDPFGALSELGLSYDKLTELLLNSPNMNDPVMRSLNSKLKSMEDKIAASESAQKQAQEAQYKDAVKQITNEVKQLVASAADYEMIKETAMEEAVVELIEQTYNSEGFLMDIEEACKQVEEHLINEGEKLARTKKLQARLAPKAEPVTQPNGKSEQSPNAIKTLTNAVSAQPTKRLSEKERIERAMAAFHGKLS